MLKFKYICISISVVLLLLMVACSQRDGQINIIYKEEALQQALNRVDKEAIMFDLRDNKDYRLKHIKGFLNIAYEEDLKGLRRYLKKHAKKTQRIYLMCYRGNRSANAFNVLLEEGYSNLTYIKFGFKSYERVIADDHHFEAGICPCEKE